MARVEGESDAIKQTNTQFLRSFADVQRICRERSTDETPPEVFLLSGPTFANSLLSLSSEFLSQGQQLRCPGLPLVGSVFGPDWGFARIEINLSKVGSYGFEFPSGHPDTYTNGDIWGFRFCPIDHHEIPELLGQLVRIRAELAKPHAHADRNAEYKVTLTEL